MGVGKIGECVRGMGVPQEVATGCFVLYLAGLMHDD